MSRRLIALLAGLLAAAALSLASVSPVWAASGMEIAFQDDALMLNGRADYALQAGRGIGATTVRMNVRWAQYNGRQAHARRAPRRPVYDFAALDRAVAAARARKTKVQLTLTSPAPAWATSDHRVGGTGVDPVKFGGFAGAVARRYRGQVARYSIWNEPNLRAWLHGRNHRETPGRPLPQALHPRLQGDQARRPARRRADRGTRPLRQAQGRSSRRLPASRHLHQHRLACARAAAAGLKADGVAVHPYEFAHRSPTWQHPNPDVVSIGSLARFNRALGKLRRAGALRTAKGRTPGHLSYGVRALRARLAARALQRDRTRQLHDCAPTTAALRAPNVKQILQYMLVRQPRATWDMGLINPNSGRPDPGYRALRTWSSRHA